VRESGREEAYRPKGGGGAIDREVILAPRKMEQDNKISDVTGLNSRSFVLRESLSRRRRMIGCCRRFVRTRTMQWHVTAFGRHPLRILAGVTHSRFRYVTRPVDKAVYFGCVLTDVDFYCV